MDNPAPKRQAVESHDKNVDTLLPVGKEDNESTKGGEEKNPDEDPFEEITDKSDETYVPEPETLNGDDEVVARGRQDNHRQVRSAPNVNFLIYMP